MTANNAAPAFATIMFLTGVGIPILAALNGGLGARLESPMAASVILFTLGLLIAVTGAIATGTLGQVRLSSGIPAHFYFGGAFMAFYAIFFVLVGQLISAATIDHFGLFGAIRSAIDLKRVAGIALMVAGVYLARRTA
ncbi:DMT family transporter [Sphingopyxis sp.]|jgi:transporter family-2 protein|uniref:DMT family transporter n=1 Tax=Sphingopyxis sp. TaxID=1908224 RepID=UPI002E023DC8|nr:DMT family transporter [Sphingopyxis sp.]